MNAQIVISTLQKKVSELTLINVMLEAQIQTCREATLVAAKLRHGYRQYGMTPWEVVHHKPEPQIPRFFSEPYRTRRGFV